MKPLAYAINILPGDAEACAGYLLPTLINIKEEWYFLHDSGMFFCEELLQCQKNGLIPRFEHELKATELQEAALHSKFCLHWISSSKKHEVAKEVRKAFDDFEIVQSEANKSKSSNTT